MWYFLDVGVDVMVWVELILMLVIFVYVVMGDWVVILLYSIVCGLCLFEGVGVWDLSGEGYLVGLVVVCCELYLLLVEVLLKIVDLIGVFD